MRSRASAPAPSEVEVVYQFLEAPEDVVSATFTRADVERARAGARGGDRADPGGRLPADAEPVRVLRVPGARPRVRRSAPRHAARSAPAARAGVGRVASAHARRGALRHPRQPAGARGGARRSAVRRGRRDRLRRRPGRRPAPAECLDRLEAERERVGSSAGTATRDVPRPRRHAGTSAWAAARLGPGRSSASRAGRRPSVDVEGLGRVLFCHATPTPTRRS